MLTIVEERKEQNIFFDNSKRRKQQLEEDAIREGQAIRILKSSIPKQRHRYSNF